jgi:phosphopantetheinyl transferase (holo-ACP synthase)
MEQNAGFEKYTDILSREEFIRIFSGPFKENEWFTSAELEKFSLSKNAGNLGARYLIKKRICEILKSQGKEQEIEILNDPLGKPDLKLGDSVRKAMAAAGFKSILCSISHSRSHVAGMTIFCKE